MLKDIQNISCALIFSCVLSMYYFTSFKLISDVVSRGYVSSIIAVIFINVVAAWILYLIAGEENEL